MRFAIRGFLALGLLGTGYLLGVSGTFLSGTVHAQDAPAQASEDTVKKVKVANDALSAAMLALQNENLYNPATTGVNSFLVSTGGGDAVADLESGRGVDPETFAALYAEQATDDVARHLKKNDEGRLTYKGKLVRMYPISRLQQAFARRAGNEEEQ